MELSGALALATAGFVAAGSAGGVLATAQAVTLGLALARRVAPGSLPGCAAAYAVGYAVAAPRSGAPADLHASSYGVAPPWFGTAVGGGWVAVGLWTLLAGRRASHRTPGSSPVERSSSLGRQRPAAPWVGAAVALGSGLIAGWMRPPHAGPVLALVSADGGAGIAALGLGTSAARAAALYHAGSAVALAVGLALAGAALQRVLSAVRLGWLGALGWIGWGALFALGGYPRAAEVILRYWPLRGLG